MGVTYDLSVGHTPGDTYRWVVTGGTITAVNDPGATITGGNTIEFAADATIITVDWDVATPGAITSAAAQIQVQKVASGCPSQVQTLPINVWSLPTANIADANVDMCSGDGTAGTITVDLTGAPSDDANNAGFDVTYTITRSSAAITDGLGADPSLGATVVSTDAASRTITLPANLINTSTADETLTVTITAANDDFTDVAATSLIKSTYVITVHPVPTTGDIVSSVSLSRR
ncbi:MAG: hypothetical protein K9H49_18765 [Bacteroidales bacterium]|nr:hypothetical protein [Bacteroidales bacterium]MCF8391660.1 hypothetical protein [Bacteroidales bacterium]